MTLPRVRKPIPHAVAELVSHPFDHIGDNRPRPPKLRLCDQELLVDPERMGAWVVVLHDKQGRARVGFEPADRLAFTIRTMDAAVVWPVDAELKAQRKLATLIPEESFQLYQLTGQFAQLSKRSQVTYLFRRGRPTIAIRQDETGGSPLCVLCLHPIGYYADTWAGVMCPTDEVIAHLLMMQGSEEKYWANANQHPVDHPAAGI